jgi:hypothetical protein
MRPCARWLLSFTLTALVLAVWPGQAQANPLDPTRFTSLGANPSNPANTSFPYYGNLTGLAF